MVVLRSNSQGNDFTKIRPAMMRQKTKEPRVFSAPEAALWPSRFNGESQRSKSSATNLKNRRGPRSQVLRGPLCGLPAAHRLRLIKLQQTNQPGYKF
jgi:hypothetical protein